MNKELQEIEVLAFETVKDQNNKKEYLKASKKLKQSKVIFQKITDRDLYLATKWDELGLEYVGG